MGVIIHIPAIVLIVIGLLVCFLGYKFFRLSLSLIGAGLGVLIAEFLFDNYASVVNLDGNEVAQVIIVALFAIGLGSLAYSLYMKAVMFITILGCGFWISSCYQSYSGDASVKGIIISWIVGILVGLIFGVAVRKVQRWAIILFTAFSGAQIVARFSAMYMITNPTLEDVTVKIGKSLFPGMTESPQTLLAGILLIMFFTAGVIVQSQGKK
ncbi:MAG: TMEM198/TM7SF3 family protein [Saccharofermentans sp.]|nr:TMEM198/TM7SF3 family protein [Saccharofermentans sp.]